MLLDAGKTGLRLKPGIENLDRMRDYGRPVCMGGDAVKQKTQQSRTFILTKLEKTAEDIQTRLLANYDVISDGLCQKSAPDCDLKRPYLDAQTRAHRSDIPPSARDLLQLELKSIMSHVNCSYETWQRACRCDESSSLVTSESFSENKKKKGSERKGGPLFTASASAYKSTIPNVLLTSDVDKVQASYAYSLQPNFAFSVAFETLCRIKADANGGAPSLRLFDEVRSVPASCQRIFARNE